MTTTHKERCCEKCYAVNKEYTCENSYCPCHSQPSGEKIRICPNNFHFRDQLPCECGTKVGDKSDLEKKMDAAPANSRGEVYHVGAQAHVLSDLDVSGIGVSTSKKNYERDFSHSHCWAQGRPPACGQPLEKHTQCCLCDTPVPANSEGKKECCPDCVIVEYADGISKPGTYLCRNTSCLCHISCTHAWQNEKRPFVCDICGNPKEWHVINATSLPKDSVEDWEKEFDEKFTQDTSGERVAGYLLAPSGLTRCCGAPITSSGIPFDGTNKEDTRMCSKCGDSYEELVKIAIPQDVKAYIRSLLSSSLQAEQERVRGVIEKEIAIHKQLESEFVGSITDIKLGVKTHNSHSFVIEQLSDLLSNLEKGV